MKTSLLLVATVLFSISAHASEYVNFIRSSVQVDCKSNFEHVERIIVSTIKVNVVSAMNEQTKNIEVYSQVQLGNKEAKRKYLINKVNFNASGERFGKNLPTFVTGSHPTTGEKISIEIQRTESNDEYQPSKLTIGTKEQTHLDLKCRVSFAG